MRYLAIVLMSPWLLILGWAYWAYPKRLPVTGWRRWFDVVALLLAGVAAVVASVVGFDTTTLPASGQFGPAGGAIWQQVLPALYSYAAFVGVLLPALLVRQLRWGRRPPVVDRNGMPGGA